MKRIIFYMLFLTLSSAAGAQPQSNDTTARYFLIQASVDNLQEIAAGKLAAQKGTSADVKMFGKMMVEDHTKAEAKLLQVAKSQNIQLPSEATTPTVPDLTLQKASGKDFDRLYVHSMLPGHGQTVSMFQDYKAMGKNEATRAFVTETLPTLKQHLAEIKSIDEKMKFAAAK